MGKRLAVIFPGIGYHCDKPILYYSRKLAKEQEYKEIISLEYSYTEKNRNKNGVYEGRTTRKSQL